MNSLFEMSGMPLYSSKAYIKTLEIQNHHKQPLYIEELLNIWLDRIL